MKEPKTSLQNPELLEFFLLQKHKTKRYLFSFAKNFGKKLPVNLRGVEKKNKAVV